MHASLNAVRRFVSISTLAVVALAGCAVRITSNTNSSGAPLAAAVIVGVMAADTVHYYRMGPDGKTPMYRAPEPDPARKINVQDCTRPVDANAGNLMCR